MSIKYIKKSKRITDVWLCPICLYNMDIRSVAKHKRSLKHRSKAHNAIITNTTDESIQSSIIL